MTTGQRIKAARKKAGMTQAVLAEKLGISYVGVSQWENDLRNPKLETLQRIASALGVLLQDLVDDWNAVDKEELKQVIVYGKGITDSPPLQEQISLPQGPTFLWDNMRYCRDFLGLTQKALAEKTGIPLKTIRAYEDRNRVKFITEEHLKKLASGLGVPAQKLLGHSVTYEWMEKTYYKDAPPSERIANALSKLNKKGQGVAAERVEELTAIPEYQAQTPVQDTPPTDTTPAETPPQRPQEGTE